MKEYPDKVLILGSGAIKIGEAAEFDYSGSQAVKALKEEGIKVVLVNPNVATVQTSPWLADRVYLLPVEWHFVEKVIEREGVDAIMPGFGGQTALNCAIDLYRHGVLEKYGVEVLGTPIEGIIRASDRGLFRSLMEENGLPVPPSKQVEDIGEALKVAEEIGFPVMVRVAYNLGGAGSFQAWDKSELEEKLEKAFAQSPVHRVLVEKSLNFWKEIEFEVVRDLYGEMAAVACLENLDPMGVHTGDSIVVAPSQTLTNHEYQVLRTASLKVAEAVGVVGECNVQLALNPRSEEYYVIETNPRMSRSSALASKATGYPLAYIAAKLALGWRLYEVVNKVTGTTTAHFEPSLDYVVVKVPRWDFEKFEGVKARIGTEMRSIGEVMAIGRCFEEALQKAFRMLDASFEGIVCNDYVPEGDYQWAPYRLVMIAKEIENGTPLEEINRRTGIDLWYLFKIKNIVEFAKLLKKGRINKNLLKRAKELGFSDKQMAKCLGISEEEVRKLRKKLGVIPVVKHVDTLAAEWPTITNYLYITYGGEEDEVTSDEKFKVIVLGAGVFRIGVSVEFDWSVVELARALKKEGVEEVETEKIEEKKVKVPKITEEPETKIERKGNVETITIKLPDVKNPEDINVRKLEQSIEVKAFVGDKAYFKLIPVKPNSRIISQKFENGILRIELVE